VKRDDDGVSFRLFPMSLEFSSNKIKGFNQANVPERFLLKRSSLNVFCCSVTILMQKRSLYADQMLVFRGWAAMPKTATKKSQTIFPVRFRQCIRRANYFRILVRESVCLWRRHKRATPGAKVALSSITRQKNSIWFWKLRYFSNCTTYACF